MNRKQRSGDHEAAKHRAAKYESSTSERCSSMGQKDGTVKHGVAMLETAEQSISNKNKGPRSMDK